MDDLAQLLVLGKAHAWAPISIIVLFWLYRALSDDSKFPITWPANLVKWKPVVIIALGQTICVIAAIWYTHVVWYMAVLHGVEISFVALGGVQIMKTIWPIEGTEPAWLKAIVLVFTKIVAAQQVTTKVAEVATDPESILQVEQEVKSVPKQDTDTTTKT